MAPRRHAAQTSEPGAGPIIGYCRTSTADQVLGIAAQREAILARYPTAEIVVEHASGKNTSGRPEFERVLRLVCAERGKIVVTKLDRLGRSVRDVRESIDRIDACGASVDIMNLGDTSSTTGKFMLTVISAFAEMERELISERTKDGLRQSKKKLGGARVPGPTAGKPGRPPSKATDPRRLAIVRVLDAGVIDTAAVLQCLDPELGVSASLVRAVRRERSQGRVAVV